MQISCQQPFSALLNGEWGVTSAASEKQQLVSMGVSACLVLTLFDPVQKIAAMAHIDVRTDISSVSNMFEWFTSRNIPMDRLEVVMGGGYAGNTGCENTALKIMYLLIEKNINFANFDQTYVYSKRAPFSFGEAKALDPMQYLQAISWGNVTIDATTGKTLFSDDVLDKDNALKERITVKCEEITRHKSAGNPDYPIKQFCDNTR